MSAAHSNIVDFPLQMIGICFHVGSLCSEASVYMEAIQVARTLFDVGESVGYHFNLLDIGGGFPGAKCTDINKVRTLMISIASD